MEQKQPLALVKEDSREGRQDYRYSFDYIALEDLKIERIGVDADVSWRKEDEELLWKYPGKPEIVVTVNAVYPSGDGDVTIEHKRQAYYAVSVLESLGLVSGWRRI